MTVLIAIVNYRCADMTIACLQSLSGEIAAETVVEGTVVEVTVVDNDSGDGSAERIAAAITNAGWGWARVIPAERNGGFAYGNNLAVRDRVARSGMPDFVWLLNPDCEVHPGALARLLEFLRDRPEVGIVGSRLEDADGTPQHSRFRFSDLAGEFVTAARVGMLGRLFPRGEYTPPLTDEAHEIDWVSGASMLVRREVLDRIGLMDEDYFLYYEEQDFQLRAREAGFGIWYVPHSRVVHHVSGSTKNFPRAGRPSRRPRYWFESRYLFFTKHHGRVYLWLTNATLVAGLGIHTLRRWIGRRPNTDPPRLLGDLLRYGFRGPRAVDHRQ